jgi:hypothetical protein
MVRWLLAELPGLVAGGVLDEDGARRMRDHYELRSRSDDRHRTSIVLSVLGALLTGGGIVLLVAHNWDSLAPLVRVGIALLILLSGQAVAGYALWRRRESTAWTEGASLYLASAVATSLALVHQVYQVAISVDSYLLWCVGLVLPTIYLLRSRAALIVVWIGTTGYLVASDWEALRADRLAWFLGLVTLTLPFVIRLYRERAEDVRTSLLGWVAAPCLGLACGRMAAGTGDLLWIPLLSGLAGAIYLFGVYRLESTTLAVWRRPGQMLGAFGTGLMFIVFGFGEPWSEQLAIGGIDDPVTLVVLLIAAALVLLCAGGAWRLFRGGAPHRALLAATPIPFTALWLAGRGDIWETVSAVTVSLYGFATGLVICLTGLKQDRLGTANAGLMLMVAILSMKFVDSDWSFLARGVGFIVLGIGFLSINGMMLKRRAEAKS